MHNDQHRREPGPAAPRAEVRGSASRPAGRGGHGPSLSFDVATLLSRRQVPRVLGLSATAFGLAACGGGSVSGTASSSSATAAAASGEIPGETAGPYPGDGSNCPDVLEQSGIVRSDIRSSFGDASGTAEGVSMELELVISDLANDGARCAGVAVYVWHCDRDGGYSLYSDGITDQNDLRGVQIADADGTVRFTSIFPACYSGRWPHIHFAVYLDQSSVTDASNAIATSQVALPQDACDAVYATDGHESSVSNLSQVSLDSDNVVWRRRWRTAARHHDRRPDQRLRRLPRPRCRHEHHADRRPAHRGRRPVRCSRQPGGPHRRPGTHRQPRVDALRSST